MKGTWQGSGTWQTTGGGGGCGLVVVVLLLLALGSGAAAAIASLIATIIAVIAIGAGAVAVMIIAGLGYLAWRRRRGGREHRQVIPDRGITSWPPRSRTGQRSRAVRLPHLTRPGRVSCTSTGTSTGSTRTVWPRSSAAIRRANDRERNQS